jgi:hypothetical protein
MQIKINAIQLPPAFIILLLFREIIIMHRDINGIKAKPIILLPSITCKLLVNNPKEATIDAITIKTILA